MDLVGAPRKQGMCGVAKAGTAIKRESTQNQPGCSAEQHEGENTEAVS